MGVRSRGRIFWLISACAILSASLTLAACGASNGGDTQGRAGGASQAGDAAVQIENCGRTLTFDKPPSRAVLPYHPIAEMFVGLGLADRAVGRFGFSGTLKQPPTLPEQARDFEAIPVVSDTGPPPMEKMLALRPDFFLAWADFDYGGKHAGAAAGGQATLDELKTAGVQVYSVLCGESGEDGVGGSIEDTYRTIIDLGKIFGVSERAEQRVAQMRQQIADVQEAIAGKPPVWVFVYAAGPSPLQTVGGLSLDGEFITLAGGQNVFGDLPEIYPDVSREGVAVKDIDAYVIYADFNAEPTDKLNVTDEATFLFETFPHSEATKNRRYVATDYVFTAGGWRHAQTVEDLARQLYPDAFNN